MLMAEIGEGWCETGFCLESTGHFSRSYLCLLPDPVFTASSNGFCLKEWVNSVTLPPWDWLVLSSPTGCNHMHRNLLKSLHEGWAWAGNKDWLLAPGTFLLVVCHDLLHLRNQNDPLSISQSDWKKRCNIVKYYSQQFQCQKGCSWAKSPWLAACCALCCHWWSPALGTESTVGCWQCLDIR